MDVKVESIEETTNEIICRVLKKRNVTLDMITPEKRIVADLLADSLDVIDIMLAIEDAFDLMIDEDEVQNIITVKDVNEFIRKKRDEN